MNKLKPAPADGMAERLDALAALFPGCVTETADAEGRPQRAVNFPLLRQLLGAEDAAPEHYEFTWVGKKAAMAEAARPSAGTLRPCPALSEDWDNTRNLYIEGDNLEVLRLLRESYLGKVKMIYIDPPYNTGSDFIYNDTFKMTEQEFAARTGQPGGLFRNSGTNGRFHSDWCSMMYARLLLARDLLTEDGAVFISIDEHELANLLQIGDEIFGEDNRLPIFHRVTKRSSNSGEHFAPCMDQILIYARQLDALPEYRVEMTEEIAARYRKTDEYLAERGPYQEVGLFMSALKHGGSSYPITCPDGSSAIPPGGLPWRWNEQTFLSRKAEGRIVFKRTKASPLLDPATGERSRWNIYTKVYLKEREVSGMHPKNFSDAFQNALASNELRSMGIPFDFAKPVSLLKFLIGLQCGKDDIVLDFFSGSATTAHAVMALNAEDGGNRRFILVQLPEPVDPESEAGRMGFSTICEIGRERIRRAGARLREHCIAPPDTGFRVFRTDHSPLREVTCPPAALTQEMLSELADNIRPEAADPDLLFWCLLRWGLPLTLRCTAEVVDGCTVYACEEELMACFAPALPESVFRYMAERRPRRAVFCDRCFASSREKLAAAALFAEDTSLRIL